MRLIRYADAPGDPEPLYTRLVDGRETGFVRDGGQCMDGKLGGAVMACDVSVTEAIEQAFSSDHVASVGNMIASSRNALPDLAGTPLPTTVIGDTIHVTVPAPPPLPDPNLPAVSLASGREYLAGALMLMGLAALVSKWRNV